MRLTPGESRHRAADRGKVRDVPFFSPFYRECREFADRLSFVRGVERLLIIGVIDGDRVFSRLGIK